MMSEWKNVRVGDLGKIITGKTPKTSNPDNYDGIIPFLTPSDNMHIKFSTSTAKTLTQPGLSEVKNCLLPPNSVCVSCIGSDLGKVVMTTKPTVTNQQINSIVPSSEYCANFIYYSMCILGKKLNFISKTSTAVPIVNKSSFSSYAIDIPPLPEQQAIAATLSCLDDKIELNNKINANLEAQAQAIFKSWFVDFEFPNKDGKPYKSSGGTMVDSELGEIPEGWRVGAISDIATDIVCGKTPSTKVNEYFGNDVPFITIPDMHGSVYVTYTERSLSKIGAESQNNKTIPQNSVCISCIATAGLVALTSMSSQTNQQINTIVCKDGISPFFIYLTMVEMSDHIKMLGSSGSTTNNLNKGQFSKIELIIPKYASMNEFSDIVAPLFEKIKYNQIQSQTLVAIRDALLPKLMSGEIEVPVEEEM